MAETKYLDYTGLSYYDSKLKAFMATKDTEVLNRSAVSINTATTPDSGDAVTFVVTQNWTTADNVNTPVEIGRIHVPLDKYVSAGAVATRQVEDPETHETETKTFIDLTITNGAGASGASTVSIDISAVAGDISDLREAINILNGNDTVNGSVAHSIKVAIEALDSEVITSGTAGEGQVLATATVATDDVNVLTGITEADGKLSAATATTLKKLASTGAAEDVTIADTGDHFTATNVEGALAELAEASQGGVASKTVYLQDESVGQSDYAKVYKLYQGANAPDAQTDPAALIGTINIPKDLVVQSGSVVQVLYNSTDGKLHEGSEIGPDVTDYIVPTGETPSFQYEGKYIKLIVQNQAAPLFIAVKDLVDVYTGGTTAEATVAISGNNEITVTINKVAATKIVYQAAGYRQVQQGEPYSSTTTYYVINSQTEEYVRWGGTSEEEYNVAVAGGELYVATPEVNVKQKIDQVETDLNALADYVGTIPPTSQATDVIGYIDEKSSEVNGAFVFRGTSATVPTTGVIGDAYLVGTAPNVKLMICTTASTQSADAVYTEIAIDTAMTGTGFQTAGNSEAATPIAPIPLTIKEYVDKLIFIGTQAQYNAAVAAGTLLENTFAVITDDPGNELTPIDDTEIDELFS